jgi:hypothetical protein
MLLCNGSPTTLPNKLIHSEFSISPRSEEFIDINTFALGWAYKICFAYHKGMRRWFGSACLPSNWPPTANLTELLLIKICCKISFTSKNCGIFRSQGTHLLHHNVKRPAQLIITPFPQPSLRPSSVRPSVRRPSIVNFSFKDLLLWNYWAN